jgi:hypothetical protein
MGILVWLITASCFAWLQYASGGSEINQISSWTVIGAYTAGYLGGYIAILFPSGLCVSEGLVAQMLGT